MIKDIEKKIQKHFYFKDTTEYIIFLFWGLFAAAFLANYLN
jgi:hypothetical protein